MVFIVWSRGHQVRPNATCRITIWLRNQKAKEMFLYNWENNTAPRAVLDGVAGEIIRSVQANA